MNILSKIIDDDIIDDMCIKEDVIEKLIKKMDIIKELKIKSEKMTIGNDELTKELGECKKQIEEYNNKT